MFPIRFASPIGRFWLLTGEGAGVFVIGRLPDERYSPQPCKYCTLSPWAQQATLQSKTALSCLCAALLSRGRRRPIAPATTEKHWIRAMAAQLELSTCRLSLMLNASLLSAWLTAEILWSDRGADLSSQSRTPLKTRKENNVNFSGKKRHIGTNQCSSQIGPV